MDKIAITIDFIILFIPLLYFLIREWIFEFNFTKLTRIINLTIKPSIIIACGIIFGGSLILRIIEFLDNENSSSYRFIGKLGYGYLFLLFYYTAFIIFYNIANWTIKSISGIFKK